MVRPIHAGQVYAAHGRWFVLERRDRAAHNNWRPIQLSGTVLTPEVLEKPVCIGGQPQRGPLEGALSNLSASATVLLLQRQASVRFKVPSVNLLRIQACADSALSFVQRRLLALANPRMGFSG
jgi:hypothetical protein